MPDAVPRTSHGLLRTIGRPALVLAAAVLLRTLLLPLARSSWPLVTGPASDADHVVSGLLVWTALVLTAWLAIGAALGALALLPGTVGLAARRGAAALTPLAVRRALSVLLGTGVGTLSLPLGPAIGAPAASTTGELQPPEAAAAAREVPDPGFRTSPPSAPPTQATSRPHQGEAGVTLPHFHRTDDELDAPSATPDPRWRPSRPVRAADLDTGALLVPAPRTTAVPDDRVTVRQGDSLWSLAARHLGPGASDREIARAWPLWYALNAEVIGPNPDLIHPGQQLRIPTPGDRR